MVINSQGLLDESVHHMNAQTASTRHRKPPILVKSPQNLAINQSHTPSHLMGDQSLSATNKLHSRDQWLQFSNLMQPQATQLSINSNSQNVTLNNSNNSLQKQIPIQSDFLKSNSGLKDVSNTEGRNSKARLKQPKPLTTSRGKSVPQERPSNSQDGVITSVGIGFDKFNNTQQLTNVMANAFSPNVGMPKTNSGVRVQSQRHFISNSNKNIKTFKNFNNPGKP